MPRQKRASDDLYNARRRARRLAERLEKEGGRYSTELARAIRATIRNSYGKRLTETERLSRELALERISQPLRSEERRSEVLKKAMRSHRSPTSPVNTAEMKAFWRITQDIWNQRDETGAPLDRFSALRGHFGTYDLQAIYDTVMSDPNNRELLDEILSEYRQLQDELKTTDQLSAEGWERLYKKMQALVQIG